MSVFFTDSNSELWYDKVEKLNIQYISMPYSLDGVESGYDLGKTHDFKTFYSKIRQGIMPKTSALSPQNYIDIFEPYLQKGEDILYVHFSSELSATFNFMKSAIDELKVKYPSRTIRYVDTRNISLGAGIVAYQAALLHNKGASDDEVINFVEKFRDEIKIYFMVDSLHHLKRGGRISSAQAVLGSMLGIKPILTVTAEGKLTSCGKANGVKKAIAELVEKLKTEGSELKKYPIGIIHADALEEANYLKQKVLEVVGPDCEIWLQEVGPTVGTHCGPGTLGLAFHSK